MFGKDNEMYEDYKEVFYDYEISDIVLKLNTCYEDKID